MNRRSFLSTIAALPFMGWGVAKGVSKWHYNGPPILDYEPLTNWKLRPRAERWIAVAEETLPETVSIGHRVYRLRQTGKL